MKLLRVVIVEDDKLIRESFANLIDESEKYICTAHYDTCEEALKNLAKDDPQLILMDIGLPGISGIEGIRRIKRVRPQIDIIVVTVHEDDMKLFEALCAGASGYLTKNIPPQKLLEAMDEIQKGGAPMSTSIAKMVVKSFQRSNESPLSTRETEVLQHLARGKSYTMIADELFIDKETVRSHIKNIYRKLEVRSKSEAIDKASRERFI
jgi:DNA-binding NarL/FixJ family response regulator